MDDTANVPIDRDAWSPSSQRSLGHYDENATQYEGIRCRCHGCEASFVCTAVEQKHAYEVRKKHVGWLPKFCPACAIELAELRSRDEAMQARWNREREAASQDAAFVREWQDVIRAMSTFGVGKSMGVHLARLIRRGTTSGCAGET